MKVQAGVSRRVLVPVHQTMREFLREAALDALNLLLPKGSRNLTDLDLRESRVLGNRVHLQEVEVEAPVPPSPPRRVVRHHQWSLPQGHQVLGGPLVTRDQQVL